MSSEILTAVSELKSRFISSNPNSNAQHSARLSHFPAGSTRSVLAYAPFPLCIRSAAGITLTSVDDGSYTDFLCEYTAGLFGHSHPAIISALHSALDNGLNFGGVNELEGKLAEALCTRFGLAKIRFTNSATEASIMALAAAKLYTGREKILVFADGYHGVPLGFPGGVSAPHNIPHDYVIAPYDDIAGTASRLSAIPANSLAAIIVEPMLGSGGCTPASVEFLQYLRTTATELGAVLIFDETMTSRLHWGGLQKKFGIETDMTVLGKYLAGGMSFGAFGGRGEVMELFTKLKHAGTFNNNALSMTGGVAAAKLLTPEVLDGVNALGDELRTRIEKALEKVSGKIGITGIGSLMAFRFHGKDEEETTMVRELLFFYLLVEEAIYIAYRGFMSISVVHERKHIDALIRAVERFVERHGEVLC